MAIILLESFDAYGLDENNMLLHGWSSIGTQLATTGGARTGTHYMLVGNRNVAVWTPPAGVGDWTAMGLAFAIRPTVPAASRAGGIEFDDNGVKMLSIRLANDLQFVRGDLNSTDVIYAIDSSLVPANSWQHIEVRVVFDNSAGELEVRLNGETVFSATGIDTIGSGTEVSRLVFGNSNNAGFNTSQFHIDDLVVWDLTGSTGNDFVGDARLHTIFPDGNETPNEYTSVGGSGFECIDETDHDGDTSYIEIANAADQAQFSLQGIPSTNVNIGAVQLNAVARKEGGEPGSIRGDIVSNGDVGMGSETFLGFGYTAIREIFELSPDTGLAFTPAEINALSVRFTKVT